MGTVKYDDIPALDLQQISLDLGHNTFDELLREIGLGNELAGVIARRLVGDTEGLTESDKRGNVAIKGTEGFIATLFTLLLPDPK